MDWAAYRARCDHPRVLSRWLLARTAQWVEPPVAAALRAAMRAPPLPKPPGHKGGPATDMFEVELDPGIVASVLGSVEQAAAEYASNGRQALGRQDTGPAPTGSLNGYLAAWREYREAD